MVSLVFHLSSSLRQKAMACDKKCIKGVSSIISRRKNVFSCRTKLYIERLKYKSKTINKLKKIYLE